MSKHKTNKRIFATSVTAAVVASAVAPIASLAATTGFPDVPANHNYSGVIKALVDAGVVQGYPNGEFRPEVQVTRAEASVMVAKILDLPKAEKSAPFADVKQNYWYTDAINSLYATGNIKGLDDGKFAPDKTMTRAEFAQLVYAAYDIKGKSDEVAKDAPFADLTADWYKEPINALYAHGLIKGVDGKNFAPQNNIKRGDFAWLLANADYAFGKKLPKPGKDVIANVASVEALNSTTVEVTFKEDIKDIQALNFKIEGLDIANAGVKQTSAKKVILTTSAQTAAKEYELTIDTKYAGKFTGKADVIPTTITTTTKSVQSVVGKEVTLTADIGQKTKGVSVTFNVDAPISSLNKDHVVEVFTDASGIATYTYTQYSAGVDSVAIYPTGAPAVRAFTNVYWAVADSLTIENADDKKGTELTNGEKKVYKVTYKDPATGKAFANRVLNVTLAENVNVTADKLSTATITDAKGNTTTPSQLVNGTNKIAQVTTDKDGVATFTVSGTNTTATPIVFIDGDWIKDAATGQNTWTGNDKLDSTELQAWAPKVTFAGAQLSNQIKITAEGSNNVATGSTNGRVYEIAVTDKDGKSYANGIVNLALNENLDKEITTSTKATFIEKLNKDGNIDTAAFGELLAGKGEANHQVKLNKDGKATFVLVNNQVDGYATPIIWIDQNTAENNQTGVLENGEPSQLGEKTFFEAPAVKASQLKVLNSKNEEQTKSFASGEVATFKYSALNQSGNVLTNVSAQVTFEVKNNSGAKVEVSGTGITTTTIEAYGTTTVKAPVGVNPSINVSTSGENASVTVSANGYQIEDSKQTKYLGNQTATATFAKFSDVELATGTVSNVVATKEVKTLTVTDAKGKTFNYDFKGGKYQLNGQAISETEFEAQVNGSKLSVTQVSGNLVFNILTPGTPAPTPGVDTVTAKTVADQAVVVGGTPITLTATDLATSNNNKALSIKGITGVDATVATAVKNAAGELVITGVKAGTTSATVTVTDGTKEANAIVKIVVSEAGESAVTVEQLIASEAARIDDNTLLGDYYTVGIYNSKLPADLKDATSYVLTVDGKDYTLTKNPFNADVYGADIDVIKGAPTVAQIKAGTVKTAK